MASSDIIKIGFDYRSSLAQFEKETNGVFDGISEKAGKQKIVIQLDAKNDKVIEKIKELQKLKLDKFTFEFGDSGIKEQLITFGQLENKINEIINLSKGLGDIVSKIDFGTKNKTEAYNQLKQMADVFKNFYGNEEAMHTKAGTEAAHAYYKAYEEALKKGVAESKLQKVTVDVNPSDSFFTADRISSTRIREFANFEKYGGEATALSEEISYFEKRLLKFSDAYSKIKINLGEAPITPEIIQNIEEYVRNLEIAEARTKDADSMGFTKEDIDLYKESADMYLGFATEDAIKENEKYISSLKEVKEEKEKVNEVISESSPTSSIDDSKFEELKSDIIEVRQELDGVKEKISGIDSEGFESIKSDVERTTESVKELNSELTELKSKVSDTSTGNKSNISSDNSTVESSQNDEVTASIRKKKEELASYELQLEETRYEIEKLAKSENEAYGFSRKYSDKQVESIRNAVTDRIFAEHDIGGRKGSNKWFALGNLTDISTSALKSYQMWQEELQKVGYALSEIRETSVGIEADILPIDGKAITNAEEFRKTLDSITTAPSENVELLNKQIAELEAKISSLKSEISSLESSKNSPLKDVFQGGSSSAEKLEQDIKNIESATDRATESAKEYRKILSQVGEFDIDSKVSAMYKRNDGQLESWTWRAKTDDDGNVLYDQNGRIDYDEPTVTVISKYEQLEKIIVKADNELRNLQKDLAEIKAYDSTASTTNIEAKISDQKEYIRLLEQTVKVISQSDEYLLDEQQIIDARNKAAREYALTMGSKQEKTDAKQSASDEKKRLANIEQVNRALNKQQITIEAIEKTYNKSTNPDLDREVSNQQDLAELAQKKFDIQTKINSLQGQERTSANEQEFLELEKLIAEYKELAKYKLKANNPSKQELGGQNLQTLIQVQISNYDKLITKAEKYGDATTDTVEKLKEQRDILSKIGADGKYTATADQYYSSRDTYKVESAALSAFEAETKAIEQKTQAVKRLKDELEGYNNQIPKKPIDGQRSDYFEGFVQKYQKAIKEAQKYLDTLGDSPVTKEVKDEWERLISVIKNAKEEMDAVPNAARGSDADSRMKEIDKLTKYLDKNTRISKEAREQLEGYLDLLKRDDPSVNVKELHTAWTNVAVAEREAGREGKSFLDIFKNKVVYNYAAQLAGYYLSFMDLIRYTRNAVSAVQELDTALVDLKKTTTMSASELERFYYDSNDVAKQMGVTTQAIIEQASAWSRLGFSTKEQATQMAELSSQFASISPGMETDQAQEGLVSIMKAWGLDENQVKSEIIDPINTLGNRFAESNADIVEGMKRSAAALAAVGTDYRDAYALFTGAQEILQNSEVAGRALRSISLRIRGYSESSEDGLLETDEELKNITGDLIDLTKTAEHSQGVSIFKEGSTTEFKSLVEYFGEISEIWDEMSEKQQNDYLQKAFAKTQAQAGAAIIQNYDAVKDSLIAMEDAAGSADREMGIIQQSIDYKLNALKETWVGTAQAIVDRGDFGKAIDSLTKLSEAIGWVIDKFGLLGTAGLVGGGILSKNGIG